MDMDTMKIVHDIGIRKHLKSTGIGYDQDNKY